MLVAWLKERLALAAARSTPVLTVDLNDGMGKLHGQVVGTGAVGPFGARYERGPAGTGCRTMLEETGMVATNTF